MSIATMTDATQQRILCPICRASNRADARFCQQCGNDVLLDNIYRLTHVIKEGGMGFVYKAVDAAGAEYAIKEMRDNFATEDERKEGIERFIEEAELLPISTTRPFPRFIAPSSTRAVTTCRWSSSTARI